MVSLLIYWKFVTFLVVFFWGGGLVFLALRYNSKVLYYCEIIFTIIFAFLSLACLKTLKPTIDLIAQYCTHNQRTMEILNSFICSFIHQQINIYEHYHMPDTVLSAEDKVVTDKAFSLKSLRSRRRMVRIGEVISSTNTHTNIYLWKAENGAEK